jgi:tetratricopeptide (TPR) repeat protein
MKRVCVRLAIALAVVTLLMVGPAWADGISDYHVANDALYSGDYKEAICYYTSAIESGDLPPGSEATAYNRRGVAHQNLGMKKKALDDYCAATKVIPDYKYATAEMNKKMLLLCSGKLTKKMKKK